MIVKTGANYQADGGYIEASREGTSINITVDGDSVNLPSIKGTPDAMVICKVSKGEGVSNGGSYGGIGAALTTSPYMGGLSLPNYPEIKEIGILFHIGTLITMPNNATPKLLDGSVNCVLKDSPTSAQAKLLLATGDDPVAILGVEE